MLKIPPSTLVPMDLFVGREPVEVDLIYANATHPNNIFGEALYQTGSRLWAHKDIAAITLLAARILYRKTHHRFSIKDCLRTTDAQAAMSATQIVKGNPDWLEEPGRMVSPPGSGAHPRGMAIDICILNADGEEVDMGTDFDEMSPKSYRSYNDLPETTLQNRKLLEDAMVDSAKVLGFDCLPLPEEWWDFRFPADKYAPYKPLADADLPAQMQMTHRTKNRIHNFDDTHFKSLADSIVFLIDKKTV